MTDSIPDIEWMAAHIAGPVSEPLAVLEAWASEHACEGASCSFCGRSMTGVISACFVHGQGAFVFCPDCSNSLKTSGVLEIPNLLWLEVSPLRGPE